jgi:hypothetical protein
MAAAADAGPFNVSGNRVARLVGTNVTSFTKVFMNQGYDTLYARWYQKWEPGGSIPQHHGSGFLASINHDLGNIGRAGYRPDGSWYRTWFEQYNNGYPYLYTYYRGMRMDCPNPNGSCYGDHIPCNPASVGAGYCNSIPEYNGTPPRWVADQWYCVELMVIGGNPSTTGSGATGTLDFWIDGVEYGPWRNFWFRTSANVKLTCFSFMFYMHDYVSNGCRYDDLVISTKRVGVGGRVTTSKDLTGQTPIRENSGASPSKAMQGDAIQVSGQGERNIRYAVSQPCRVRMSIYNNKGELVRVLADEDKGAGNYQIQWNGKDLHGEVALGGIYLCRLMADDRAFTKKIMWMP